ncbi:MAG: DUF3943 domain-containing protein [Ignavibacteria bacterium]|nr:DUF3943 domain-containing protein [Ignavibacteria bacterium]
MPINKFTLFIVLVLLFAEIKFTSAQEAAGEKLTLKSLTEKISGPDDPDIIKLRFNSGTSAERYSSSVIKDFSEVNSNVLSKSFDVKSDKYNSLSPKQFPANNKEVKIKLSKDNSDDYIPWEANRHFGLAVFDELFFNIAFPWALARFGRDWEDSTAGERWPFIGFQSIWSNIQKGWNYDGDNFTTNLFAHPYGGNIFFNSGRVNGYNFWESSAFALAGSYLWESFMETNQPAINDWVNTGMNGAAFGEILYRLSTYITDNQARGGHRVWTEIVGGIVNPVRLFNRLVTGEASRIFPNPSWRQLDNLEIAMDAGTRVLFEEDSTHNPGPKELDGIFELAIHFGNAYRLEHATPFSHFYYNIEIASSSPNLTGMNAEGSLFAVKLSDKPTSKHSLETTLNYNYENNPGFLYGNAAIMEQLNSLFKISDKLDLRTKLGLRLIPMGGTPNDYFYDSLDGRSYDFGQGLGAIGRISLHMGDWDIFTIQYDLDYIWTQSEPTYSKHFLQGGTLDFQLPIKDYFVFGVGAGYYKRKSYYFYPQDYFGYNVPGQPETNAPDVSFQTPIVRVFFKTRIL